MEDVNLAKLMSSEVTMLLKKPSPVVKSLEIVLRSLAAGGRTTMRNFSPTFQKGQQTEICEIRDLQPNTEYEMFVYFVGDDGPTVASERLHFRTLPDFGDKTGHVLSVHPVEILIVLLILFAWIATFVMFVHKWGRIRIVGLYARYQNNPKNLETIKVVKRPNDSVIYRNYSAKLSSTMLARQKNLERMNTMPKIRLLQGTSPVLSGLPNVSSHRQTKVRSSNRLVQQDKATAASQIDTASDGIEVTQCRDDIPHPLFVKEDTLDFDTFVRNPEVMSRRSLLPRSAVPLRGSKTYTEQLNNAATALIDFGEPSKPSKRSVSAYTSPEVINPNDHINIPMYSMGILYELDEYSSLRRKSQGNVS